MKQNKREQQSKFYGQYSKSDEGFVLIHECCAYVIVIKLEMTRDFSLEFGQNFRKKGKGLSYIIWLLLQMGA